MSTWAFLVGNTPPDDQGGDLRDSVSPCAQRFPSPPHSFISSQSYKQDLNCALMMTLITLDKRGLNVFLLLPPPQQGPSAKASKLTDLSEGFQGSEGPDQGPHGGTGVNGSLQGLLLPVSPQNCLTHPDGGVCGWTAERNRPGFCPSHPPAGHVLCMAAAGITAARPRSHQSRAARIECFCFVPQSRSNVQDSDG